MVGFKRLHNSGTEALVQETTTGWRVQINLHEPHHSPMTIAGYIEPTVEHAKEIADKEVLKYGHVCNEFCKDWVCDLAAANRA